MVRLFQRGQLESVQPAGPAVSAAEAKFGEDSQPVGLPVIQTLLPMPIGDTSEKKMGRELEGDAPIFGDFVLHIPIFPI